MQKNKKYLNSEVNINVDSIPVDLVHHTKFLGVYIDSKLNWNKHVDHVASKVAKNIGVITRARKVLDKKTLTGLYYTFIYPYLNYCCTVWGSCSITHISKLLVLQKRIVRIICGKPRLSPSLELFKSLKILPVKELQEFKLSIFCFKFKHQKLPSIFDDFLTNISDIHSHETRASEAHELYIHTPRTCYGQNAVRYQAPFTWNSLGSLLCSISCYKTFKRNTIDQLLHSYERRNNSEIV